MSSSRIKNEKNVETEFSGPVWSHPYALYIILTGLIFVGILGLAYVVVHFDLIPTR